MDIAKITETPEELIRFSLALRNHGVASKSNDLDLRVNEILSLLDLEKCRSTVFGSTMLKGLSGGEKKRTVRSVRQVGAGGGGEGGSIYSTLNRNTI